MNKKNKIITIVLVVVLVIAVIVGFSVTFIKHNESKTQIETTNYKQEVLTLGPDGEEYTVQNQDGKKYLVNKNGMFYIDDNNNMYKINENINISPYRTYKVTFNNGSSEQFTLHSNGKYEMAKTYEDGNYMVAKGEFKMKNGLEECVAATKLTQDKFCETFGVTNSNTINQNNLLHVTMFYDSVEEFDANGDKLVYDETIPEPEEDIPLPPGMDIAEEFVIFLNNTDNIQEDSNGNLYYSINATAVSVMYDILFSEYSVNGPISVSGVHYLEKEWYK